VRGLTAEDFEVFDGRRKQRITDFEVIDLEMLGGDVTGPTAVPLPARRHFLLLFDLSFSDPGKVTRARHAARDVVAHRLHPTDLVAVATYSSAMGARWVLGFTSDRRQVDVAIEDLGLGQLTEQYLDPLALVRAGSLSPDGAPVDIGGRGAGREGIFQDLVNELTLMLARTERDSLRGHALAMVQGIESLGERLRWVQGRKHVVLLSQGFQSSLLFGTENQGRVREMNEAAMSGEYWKVDSDERFGSSASLSVVERLLDELRRADATVHAVDITGIVDDPLKIMDRPKGEDSLFVIADGTGGELYRNFNDLGEAMEQLLDRTSVTYVLSFQPRDLPMDGSFHPIRVRLAGDRDGARVVHRPGYYAPLPWPKQSVEARQIAAAQLLLGGEVGGPIPVAVLAPPLRGAGELAYVPLVLEIDGPALLAGSDAARPLVLDLYAYALDRDGEVRDFVSQQVALDPRVVAPLLRQRGIKFHGHLDLPPGQYSLRILVRDITSGRSTVQETALTVHGAAERQPVLLPPLFSDAATGWLVLREQPRPGEPVDAMQPFLLEGKPFLPASQPVIAPGGEAQLVLMAYDAEVEGRRLEGRVLDAAGAEIAPAVLQRTGTAAGPQTGLEQLMVRFQAAGLRPGQYRLEVRLVDPGGEALISSIPFLVRLPSG
jgi:VWFA-related protein